MYSEHLNEPTILFEKKIDNTGRNNLTVANEKDLVD